MPAGGVSRRHLGQAPGTSLREPSGRPHSDPSKRAQSARAPRARWPALPLPGPRVHQGADLLQLFIHAVQCAATELHGRRRNIRCADDGPLDAERRSEPHDRGGGETDENRAQHVAEAIGCGGRRGHTTRLKMTSYGILADAIWTL